jgi:hypothetical protein
MKMIRYAAVALIILLVALSAHGQAPSAFPYAKLIPNDTAVGTTQFTLTKINSSGNAVIMATADTNGYAGICVDACGNTGSAWISFAGLTPLIMDATATTQHYVKISAITGGDGLDSGAITYPTAGGSVIGRIQAGCSGAACKAMIDLFPAENSTVSAAGARRTCDIAIGDTSSASVVTNAQLGPQKRVCYIPAAATILELDVAADGGTPNVIVGRNTAGTLVNIVSAALATAAAGGIACSNTGGTLGLDGATTCSATLQNTALAQGAYLELVSGTAGGTAKFMTIHIIYLPN